MERLTERYEDEYGSGIFVKEGHGEDALRTLFRRFGEPGDYASCDEGYCAIETLAAYEDTGITPKQLHDLNRMYRELATEYGKYKKAEEQGLLLKLPCKVGDTVWYINERIEKQGRKKVTVFFVDDGSVDNITLGGVMIPQIEVCNNKENSWITFDYKEDWNKTVFLTRTEAEEAL